MSAYSEDNGSSAGSVSEERVASSATALEATTKTQELLDGYLKRYQIWSSKSLSWVPYDPTSHVSPPPPVASPNVYFYVNVQWQTARDRPQYIISHFSEQLLGFFRSLVGGVYFDDNVKPNVADFFPLLKQMQEMLNKIRAAGTAGNLDDMREVARSMGCKDIHDDTPPPVVLNALKALYRQLEVLVKFVNEQFSVISERLNMMRSHGMIEFDLLVHFFEKGQDLVTLDHHDQLIAFRCTEVRLSEFGHKQLAITGEAREWNGKAFSVRMHQQAVQSYPGTKRISELPVRHITATEKSILEVRGKIYAHLAGVHHKAYNGNRIIVDRLAHQNQSGYIRDPNQIISSPNPKDLYLFPSAVRGFDLVKKTWESFEVDKVEDIKFDEHAWDHLVLDPSIKTLIKGLVTATTNDNTGTRMISDVISGKGGGLIAVLHGPPGTGKTLTAEAVAETLRRPLYMVSTAQLEPNPSTLEAVLKSILQLGTAWDAVILIDEADVFLEQRSLHDLNRNALVSVALRTLEYHRGVLFLTTNRIKTFDEAFLSRFSIAIRYQELDQAGRLAVWQKFLELAGCSIAERPVRPGQPFVSPRNVERLAEKRFNGRTIKNLVRTSQVLALSMEESLSIDHISVAIKAQEKFYEEMTME